MANALVAADLPNFEKEGYQPKFDTEFCNQEYFGERKLLRCEDG